MKREIDSEPENPYRYTMEITTPHTTIEFSLDQFLLGLDKSPATIQAYHTDIQQFLDWLHANDFIIVGAQHVTSSHINDYLSYLANQGRTGTTRARKLVSIRLFFTYLVSEGVIPSSPSATIKNPLKKSKPKHALRSDEFQRIIGEARGNPRDYALLQLIFQTGIRVSEVITIHLSELDLEHSTLTLHRKGRKKCTTPLEKKTLHALQSYLVVRPETHDTHLFLNYQGQGLSIGGVRKMVEKYVRSAGIPKKITCHGLHYTCSSHSSPLGMIDFHPNVSLRNERIRTPKNPMPLETEGLRKLLEFTSL